MVPIVSIDKARDLVKVVTHQTAGVGSFIEILRRLNPNPWVRSHCHVLFDLTNDGFVPTSFQAVTIASVVGSFFPNQRIAFVFANPVKQKAGEFFGTLVNSSVRLRICSSVGDAEQWLAGNSRGESSASVTVSSAPDLKKPATAEVRGSAEPRKIELPKVA